MAKRNDRWTSQRWLRVLLVTGFIATLLFTACTSDTSQRVLPAPSTVATSSVTTPATPTTNAIPVTEPAVRGYLTTPGELRRIAERARAGIEPYKTAVEAQLAYAAKALEEKQKDAPKTLKFTGGDIDKPLYLSTSSIDVYTLALAYGLLRDSEPDVAQQYAERAYSVIMAMPRRNTQISGYDNNSRLNLAVYIPNFIYTADLLAEWPLPTSGVPFAQSDDARLLKTWLGSTIIRYPYNAAYTRVNNWGAWGRHASAVIADYVGDAAPLYVQRFVEAEAGDFEPDPQFPCDPETVQTCISEPAGEIYASALQLHIDMVDGKLWEFSSTSCDAAGSKSMIRPDGGIPDELRRQYACDATRIRDSDGPAARYSQFAIEAMVCLAEMAWRRGDASLYTHQDPASGRGALFRAIRFLVDNDAKLTRGSMIEIANQFYTYQSSVEQDAAKRTEFRELVTANLPAFLKSQDDWPVGPGVVGFGTLTHGFAADEPPPVVSPRLPPG